MGENDSRIVLADNVTVSGIPLIEVLAYWDFESGDPPKPIQNGRINMKGNIIGRPEHKDYLKSKKIYPGTTITHKKLTDIYFEMNNQGISYKGVLKTSPV